ncbi:MAG: hypothetical protein JJ908_16290 [Rhizobiales bacterium]|nr:hypothetical protein [Hyphomicrobiales bacterium]MBO6700392.1 hypothetical protein [Hyphomicrobiales bacterium]MBO6737928.1 hypothetical protein [Hyphomicrobiales bacterium]MBO6913765.1 hypothetical protein [Hyphomicrobiales bacterium]MBO6954340.1 hypothetical protein [Hyphomicrobiales bacterium]
MNRLDPRLEARSTSRVLDSELLSRWSADGFALAQKLARAPLTVTGGFANTRLTLALPSGTPEPPDILVPVPVDGHEVEMAFSASALDWLVGLLDRDQAPGAGRTLSFDAMEALLAGLLAPLNLGGIGRARLATTSDNNDVASAVAVLHGEGTAIPVLGTDAALLAFHARIAAKTDRLVAAPLSYLRVPDFASPAVMVETLVGMVRLDADERGALEAGGGVRLDAHWPGGRCSVGRRFVADQEAWRIDACLSGDPLIVRSGMAARPLDDPALATTLIDDGALELLDGDKVVATGHLVSLAEQGQPHPIFVLDGTASRP